MVIDDVELLPLETVLVADEYVEEIEVEGRRIRCPRSSQARGPWISVG